MLSHPSSHQPTRRRRSHHPSSRTYKAHQRYVIDYLTNKCTRQDGLLLYHYMGSGKTLTAIGIMANLKMPTVLVAPAGILGMWRTQYFATYKRVLPFSIECYDFEGFWKAIRRKGEAWRRERLLIVDEAHNLAQWLSTKLPVDRRKSSLQALFEFKKRILLTGTPMYWSEHDLSFLVNIAQGKATIPIDPNQFRERYFTVKKSRSLFEGWFSSTSDVIHNMVMVAIKAIASTTILSNLLDHQSFVKPKHVQTALEAIETPFVYGTTIWYKLMHRACKPLIKRYYMLQILDQMLHATAIDEKGKAVQTATNNRDQPINPQQDDLQRMQADLRNYEAELIHRKVELDNYKQKEKKLWLWRIYDDFVNGNMSSSSVHKRLHEEFNAHKHQHSELQKEYVKLSQPQPLQLIWGYFKKKTMIRPTQVQFWYQLLYLLTTLVVTWLICLIIRQFYCRESDLDLLHLNHAKLVGEMAPYVSYYAPSLVREDAGGSSFSAWRTRLFNAFRGKPTTVHRRGTRFRSSQRAYSSRRPAITAFPVIRSVVKTVSYDHRQYRMFVRYTMGKLSFKDYAQLTVIPHERDGITISFDQSDGINFRQYGRMIGNTCTFSGGGSAGYRDHLVYDPKAYAYILRHGHAFQSVAPKFEAFLKHIRKHLGKRRVVYSNFGEASATLSAYLSARGVTHRYLRDRSEGAGATHSSSLRASSSTFKSHGGKKQRSRHKKTSAAPLDTTAAPIVDDVEYSAIMDWVKRTPNALLILDQSYSEGVSIRKVDEFHLLDPCESVAKDDQTKARVVRLDSHPPGAKVTIVEWISSLAMLANTLDWVREWFDHRAFVLFTHMLTDHKQTVTPDAVVRQEVHQLAKSTLKVMTLLRPQSIERYAREPMPARCGAALERELVEVRE